MWWLTKTPDPSAAPAPSMTLYNPQWATSQRVGPAQPWTRRTEMLCPPPLRAACWLWCRPAVPSGPLSTLPASYEGFPSAVSARVWKKALSGSHNDNKGWPGTTLFVGASTPARHPPCSSVRHRRRLLCCYHQSSDLWSATPAGPWWPTCCNRMNSWSWCPTAWGTQRCFDLHWLRMYVWWCKEVINSHNWSSLVRSQCTKVITCNCREHMNVLGAILTVFKWQCKY